MIVDEVHRAPGLFPVLRGLIDRARRAGRMASQYLLLARPDGGLWAVEIKRSLSPKIERGFDAACQHLSPVRKFVVCAGQERYRIAPGIEGISLAEPAAEIFAA